MGSHKAKERDSTWDVEICSDQHVAMSLVIVVGCLSFAWEGMESRPGLANVRLVSHPSLHPLNPLEWQWLPPPPMKVLDLW